MSTVADGALSGRPLLVGEANPYGSDPTYALYPLPQGASGDRLRKILGLSRAQYMDTFDRINLCAGRWSMREAKAAAEEIAREDRPMIVLLGRKVAAAFGLQDRGLFDRVGRYVLLPHPSGRNPVWNDPQAAQVARRMVLDG